MEINDVQPKVVEMSHPNADLGNMNQVLLWSAEELSARKIIFPGMQQREVLNKFREIRTKILINTSEANLVILVTAVGAGAGASFTAINIAAAFAMDEGKTAVYIDCNLDAPFSDYLLPTKARLGLTDYLAKDNINIESIIYSTGLPRLRVIPPGSIKDRATEYLSSRKMQHFIDVLKKRYADRYLVIDCPSVMSSIEARVLSQYCDAKVLVIPSGKVTGNQILAGIDAIGKNNFSGVVFNN